MEERKIAFLIANKSNNKSFWILALLAAQQFYTTIVSYTTPCSLLGVGNDLPQDQNPGEVRDYCFFCLVHVISHLNLDAIGQNLNL
jgi:hypothetical protein